MEKINEETGIIKKNFIFDEKFWESFKLNDDAWILPEEKQTPTRIVWGVTIQDLNNALMVTKVTDDEKNFIEVSYDRDVVNLDENTCEQLIDRFANQNDLKLLEETSVSSN
jgi:hypothetical protein